MDSKIVQLVSLSQGSIMALTEDGRIFAAKVPFMGDLKWYEQKLDDCIYLGDEDDRF